jgi:hypothetical protein
MAHPLLLPPELDPLLPPELEAPPLLLPLPLLLPEPLPLLLPEPLPLPLPELPSLLPDPPSGGSRFDEIPTIDAQPHRTAAAKVANAPVIAIVFIRTSP